MISNCLSSQIITIWLEESNFMALSVVDKTSRVPGAEGYGDIGTSEIPRRIQILESHH